MVKFRRWIDYNDRWQLRLYCFSLEFFGYVFRLEVNKL